jgi:arylsulfatase A-like enzyme
MEMNIFEPHRPFPRDEDVELLRPEEVGVPGYLPDLPSVREDLVDLEASIVTADRAFGRVVEALRQSDIGENTVIILTADHGIALTRDKMTLYDPGIEVPLIIAGPGIAAAQRLDPMISNVDVTPTVLDLAGLAIPEEIQGRSFAPLLRGEAYEANETIYAEKNFHIYYDPMRCVRTKDYKLIVNFEHAPWQETPPNRLDAKGYAEIAAAMRPDDRNMFHPPMELYNLRSDPLEQKNLADDPAHAGVRRQLAGELRTWMERTDDPLLEGPVPSGAYRQRLAQFMDAAKPKVER